MHTTDTCIYEHARTHTHARTRTRTLTCTQTFLHVCTYYKNTCALPHGRSYTHTHTLTHVHKYTHTNSLSLIHTTHTWATPPFPQRRTWRPSWHWDAPLHASTHTHTHPHPHTHSLTGTRGAHHGTGALSFLRGHHPYSGRLELPGLERRARRPSVQLRLCHRNVHMR
jgi:hypothetical protein